MTMNGPSRRIRQIGQRMASFNDFFLHSKWAQRAESPEICDFVLGNPHDMPLPEFVDALQRWSVPQNEDWFAYKESEPKARATVAAALRQRRGVPFAEEDILMTNGAFAGLSVTLTAVTDPGDEVIFISPPWFFYEAMITAAGATPVRVNCDAESFDLDLAAIAAAVTPRTRAIIINSPNNPTGKIYPAETLQGLADLLETRSEENGRAIYLLSDEAYCRIVYDGRSFPSPTAFYDNSFLIYTYGKTLLTPGQRLGYVALPPAMPHREQWREAVYEAQLITGFAFPNALLQHALPDIEPLSIDVDGLQGKRDRLVAGLRRAGYELHVPEGTFYLLVRSPLPDDGAFLERLAAHDVYCLPGSVVDCPGYFRVSLTANEEMIERALPRFRKVLDQI